MRITIRGGRLIDPASQYDATCDLHIAAGKIVARGAPPDGFSADQHIDATRQWVLPGLVDLSARLREPGQEHKGTIASETRAAAAGGVTTLCCPPDTQPVIDTPAVIELIHRQAQAAGFARVLPLGALTAGLEGKQLSEMYALKQAGCIGVSNALVPITNTLVMRRAMEYAANHGLSVFVHAEDPWLRNQGCVHEGMISTRLGLPGIPEAAETVAVARELILIEQTGVRAHFCQLSSARAVQMIARAQYDGLPITADVTAHHLHLSEMDVGYFNSQCHIRPPLRTQRDRDGLRTGLAQGILGALCSDHQPHEPDAKLVPFTTSEPGASALETLLPLGLQLVEDGVLSLSALIERLTLGPARILGIAAGTLAVGVGADVCILDPECHWRVEAANLHSHGHNSPCLGWDMQGRVTHTLLDGRLVHTLATAPI